MEKLFIKNRQGKRIAVIVQQPESNPIGLVFVMHGLSGFKEQPHIQTMAEVFLENGYIVVRFDTTNTFGESEGDYEDATTTNYYDDLCDVIEWSKSQSWYREPFVLVGHSLGGISTALFAENFPDKIKALAPISSVISGMLTVEKDAANHPDEYAKWESTGWKEQPHRSKPGRTKRLKWHQYKEDVLQYDLLPNARKLTMPVLMVVGDLDRGTPLEHQKLLFDKLPGPKELHVIRGSPHTFRDPEHLKELRNIFDQWLKKSTKFVT